MKKIVVLVSLFCFCSLHCSVGSGLGKVWEGTKDIVSGTIEFIATPFRGNGEADKTTKKEIQKQTKNKK